MNPKLKKLSKYLILGIILTLIVTFAANYYIKNITKEQLYNSVTEIPKNKVGLLLGTSKLTRFGNLNTYYKNRIEAAAALFHAGKIEYIIVSGDNSIKTYNETEDMKFSLMEKGVPEDKIFEDFAGFRTLDSVVRSKEIFGQDSITIISQPFHNERALFLANHFGMNAIAFNAKEVSSSYGFKTQLREYLARVKAVLDVYILKTEPKFFGDTILISEE